MDPFQKHFWKYLMCGQTTCNATFEFFAEFPEVALSSNTATKFVDIWKK